MRIYNVLRNISKKVALNYVHPVGEIFISADASFNPNNTWGGVWQKLTDKFLVGAGDTYTLGATGGEATHTLTIDEMPSHWHRSYVGWTSGSQYVISYTDNKAHQLSGVQFSESVGGSQAHNNLPPYQAVFMWQRTA